MEQLELRCDLPDAEILAGTRFFEQRAYVARSMIPEGYEAFFKDQSRFINANTSTAIEGHRLDFQQALLVLIHGPDEDEPDQVATVNTEAAYALVDQLAGDCTLKVDQGLLRTLNSVLLKGMPGRAAERRGQFRIGGAQIVDAETRAVRYNPPPPVWVPSLMEHYIADFNRWIEEDSPPVAAAKAHFGLVSIHPFEDGNGRTARLVQDFVLGRKGWTVDGMLSVNPFLLDNRDEYYETLRLTQGLDFTQDVDVAPFATFLLHALQQSAIRLEERAITFSRRKDDWTGGMGEVVNTRQAIGLMYMVDMGPLSSSDYARLSDCSTPTALSDLNELVNADIVVKLGASRATRYGLKSSLRAGH